MRIAEFNSNHASRQCVRTCMMSSAYELTWALKMYEETFMAWKKVYNSTKVNTELFFWPIWELSCRMLSSLVNTCASCRLLASVAKGKKQYIYAIKLKFLTEFLNRIYEKFEQREAIRTFFPENLEHVLSIIRGPVYWII